MDELYVYLVVALLPIASLLQLLQENPYQALVVRGILGAIAVLSYIVLGAADVALTEALVGTLLGIILYIVAVRSSFVIRLGVVKGEYGEEFKNILEETRKIIKKIHLRLELVYSPDEETLQEAFCQKQIHGFLIYSPEKKYILHVRTKGILELIGREIKTEYLILGGEYDKNFVRNGSSSLNDKNSITTK
ncbi:MAG: DUF4040 domain-containing protein [Geminocystis sp.]|nr:DUF4040 domain-containing protein [Geminocystis sp.]HIK37511.1 DUF4040 domain-containing protein [Geminocystis sp. M7585_C2015_104]MCS7148912.1 DUF4040 domain-containing protein [Geminocystis sp.]MCX8077467.1 DUF4040 domain-containing protein [Geminocystis sp.]MDW8116997.1 DUF4040 domain-containing protein [Geminocystis sp.]